MRTFLDQKTKLEFLKTPVVDRAACKEIVGNVNNLVERQDEGRLFAVVHICGRQYKVTAGDILVIEGYWAPTIGDELRLEKVIFHTKRLSWLKSRGKIKQKKYLISGTACRRRQFHYGRPTHAGHKCGRCKSHDRRENHRTSAHTFPQEATKAIHAHSIPSIGPNDDPHQFYRC